MTMSETLEFDDDRDETEGAADIRQFVSFHLGKECFGFPIETVQEIIRVPTTVSVPLTPPVLTGLANLRGEVLPVLDLRTALDLPPRAPDDASRVIVVDAGQRVGLIVDRVARVLNVDPQRIEDARDEDGALSSDVLRGVAKGIEGIDMPQLLDVRDVVRRQFPDREVSVTGPGLGAGKRADPLEVETEEEMIQLVSLLLNGEEYAFPIGQVDEIVRVPEQIAQVPKSQSHVLGLITLRDRLLPIVSLRRLFGLPDTDRADHNRVMVITLGTTPSRRVGMVVDQVREVLRIRAETRDKLPGVLRRGDRDEIEAVCQLDDGQRLVSILSATALLDLPAAQEALALEQDSRAETGMDPDTEEEAEMGFDATDEMQLVVYQLDQQEYGVNIHDVQEIIRVPEQLSRVPNAPATVEGIINLRGSVLPVVELRRMFSLPDLPRHDRQRILVLTVDGKRTGFIVDSVTEVLRIPGAALDAAPRMPNHADHLVQQVAKLDAGRRMLLITHAETLVGAGDLADVTRPEPAIA